MECWYQLVNQFLPFDWVHYDFMKNALLAVLLISPIFGLTGTMVVNNRMAFFSDAIGHAALTGIAIGILMGASDPSWIMLIFAALLAVFMSWARIKTEASPDTVIGVFFATAVALGVVVLSRGGGFNKYSHYLIGDILSITPQDILQLFVVLGLVVAFWFILFNRLFLVSFNPSVARSRGIKVLLIETCFSVVVAVIVTISIQLVGILIINSLLILPAAASRNLTRGMRSYHGFAVIISVISGIAGLILSYYWGTATGATIVLAVFAVYLASIIFRSLIPSR